MRLSRPRSSHHGPASPPCGRWPEHARETRSMAPSAACRRASMSPPSGHGWRAGPNAARSSRGGGRIITKLSTEHLAVACLLEARLSRVASISVHARLLPVVEDVVADVVAIAPHTHLRVVVELRVAVAERVAVVRAGRIGGGLNILFAIAVAVAVCLMLERTASASPRPEPGDLS